MSSSGEAPYKNRSQRTVCCAAPRQTEAFGVNRTSMRTLFLVLIASLVAPGISPADCVLPDIEPFLEKKFHGSHFPALSALRIVTTDDRGRTVQWRGVKWYGPTDGALFVLDCEGKTLAIARLGGVDEMRQGPILPCVGTTVEVRYQPLIATGYRLQLVELVAFHDNDILRLWRHISEEDVFVLWGDDGTEDRYSWTFSQDGRRIQVRGRRSVYPKPPPGEYEWGTPTTHDLPLKTYCWVQSKATYQRCSARKRKRFTTSNADQTRAAEAPTGARHSR